MKLIWSAPALRDIDRLVERHHLISPDLADEMIARIEAAPAPLLDFPKMGEQVGRKRSRKWPIAGTPFILIVEPKRGALHIKRVRHVREDWRKS